MTDIGYILDLFDWNQSPDNQKAGLELAKKVTSINVFLQPGDEKHNKNVWENCAKTLYERSDSELKPYLDKMMEWLIDMNWPGAFCIFERLKLYDDKVWLKSVLSLTIERAKALKELIWLDNLEFLRQNLGSS